MDRPPVPSPASSSSSEEGVSVGSASSLSEFLDLGGLGGLTLGWTLDGFFVSGGGLILVYALVFIAFFFLYVPGQLCAGDEVPLSSTEASASSSTMTSSNLSS